MKTRRHTFDHGVRPIVRFSIVGGGGGGNPIRRVFAHATTRVKVYNTVMILRFSVVVYEKIRQEKKTPPQTEGPVLSAQTREPDRVTFGKLASVTVAAAAAAAIGRADGLRPPPPPPSEDPAKYPVRGRARARVHIYIGKRANVVGGIKLKLVKREFATI